VDASTNTTSTGHSGVNVAAAVVVPLIFLAIIVVVAVVVFKYRAKILRKIPLRISIGGKGGQQDISIDTQSSQAKSS
jgi:tellurite resistance protein TehA-like permease